MIDFCGLSARIDQVISMAKAKSISTVPAEPKSGQVREVPVSADALKRSAAQELSDPPRFPTLK